MAREVVFPGATVLQFRNLFQPKREYREAIGEMGLKERLFDWKPTTELEKQFQAHLTDKAIVKVGSGMLKITSYRLNDLENECSTDRAEHSPRVAPPAGPSAEINTRSWSTAVWNTTSSVAA